MNRHPTPYARSFSLHIIIHSTFKSVDWEYQVILQTHVQCHLHQSKCGLRSHTFSLINCFRYFLVIKYFQYCYPPLEMASRVTDTISKIPFVTTSLLVLNCGIHAVIFLLSLDINKFAISGDQVLKGEYYRVFSATFVHGGIMHIAMNMSSLLQIGTSLEAQFGSAQFAILTLWSTILIGAVYVLLSW